MSAHSLAKEVSIKSRSHDLVRKDLEDVILKYYLEK